ncbi:MAG: barstar family protein [Solobacterium sp.]|nr:barstar family protein [Solobacterium sp.]
MKTRIDIDDLRMTSKKDIHAYLKEVFNFPEYYGKNLDALYDSLCEIDEDKEIVFTDKSLRSICDNEYAYRVLMVFGKAAMNNPHLHIQFRRSQDD